MSDLGDENPLRQTIYQRMREKETDELIEIYQENDLNIWTADALEAVRQILIERLGELPGAGEAEEDVYADEEYEEREYEYPSDRRLIWIADLAN